MMTSTIQRRALALTNRAIARAERGESVSIEVEAPARPLLERFLDEGVFRRVLLLIERDGQSARIAARPRRLGGATRITEMFEEDHRRLDELAAMLRKSALHEPMRAVVLAKLLVWGLRRHIRAEEQLVFPIYVARSKFAAKTAEMHVEHVALFTYLDVIEREADDLVVTTHRDSTIKRLLVAEAGLAAVLAHHNQKEEQGLFPLLDNTLEPSERARVLRDVVLF